MGGNGSYSKSLGGVPEAKRLFYDTNTRVEGHKVLLSKECVTQSKIPMNSNSENPIYLCGKVDKKTGEIRVTNIAIYDKHKISKVIDLKFDKKGDFIPYSSQKDSSHSHSWKEKDGELGRKSHDKSNVHPIPSKYLSLIERIVEYNKAKRIWKG